VTDADRLRAMLERLRLSQRGLARAIDCDERVVRRWCAGQQPVPTVVWLALDGLASRLPAAPLH
jgi:DNA-binding transcriptional regulator YiaG